MSTAEEGEASGKSLVEAYAGNPVIRGLVQLIPGGVGGAIDTILMDRASRIQQKRQSIFFDELSKGNVKLDEAAVDNDDFLHKLDITLRAATRTQRDGKIRMFSRLFRNDLESASPDIDEYEEFVRLLDDLSYREWEILTALDDALRTVDRNEMDSEFKLANSVWEKFEHHLQANLRIEKDEIQSTLTRLIRTGLYREITGSYWDYEGGLGIVTPQFERFRSKIESEKDKAR